MPKQSLASIAKSVRTAMKKHSPEILTGIGIAGMITTSFLWSCTFIKSGQCSEQKCTCHSSSFNGR